jgi:chaperonin GroEL
MPGQINNDSFKSILFKLDAQREILAGVNVIADAVKATLGPRGRNAVIVAEGGPPVITKDGVTVARCINLRDTFKDLGVQMVKEAASRTNDVAGDGTTTATVLMQAIFSEGCKIVAAGHSPVVVKQGIDAAVSQVIANLQTMATPVTAKEAIAQVGTISANGDAKIGSMLADAMERVGKSGILTVEESKGFDTTLDVVEGLQFDVGYLSPYFITNQERMVSELENPLVLITSKKITSAEDIQPILEVAHRLERSILIIGDEVDGQALQMLTVNKLRGTLRACAIRAPLFGQHRLDMLEDLAVVTGGTVISAESGIQLSKLTQQSLGSCRRVTVTRGTCTFVGGPATQEIISARLQSIDARLTDDSTLSEDEQAFLQARMAKLSGGVAVIRVGGSTAVEVKERKDRVEDAMNATRAAVEEGIVPGGGVALVMASTGLVPVTPDMQLGYDIVRRACESPLRQIVKNAGGEDSVVINKIRELSTNCLLVTMGYDAATDRYVEMIGAGIIDPVKVTRCALENAASVAGLLLTVDVAIGID